MDNDLDRVRASWEQRAVESGASLSGVLLRNLSENANRTLDEWHATILRDALLPEVRTGARVLDLGCGYGRLSRVIASARPDIDVIHFRYNAAHPGAETDIFPHLPAANRSGLVSFTATSWGQLLKPSKALPGERIPTATDCYRFVMSRPEVDVCLSGPGNATHMDEALRALELGPMNAEELAWMRRVGAAVAGKTLVATP